MSKLTKKVLIFVLVTSAVVLFAYIPFLYFNFIDSSLLNSEHPRRPIDNQLDPLVDELYITGAIREAYVLGDPMNNSDDEILNNLNQEINKLKLAGIKFPNEINIEGATQESLDVPINKGPSWKYNTACVEINSDDTVYQIQFYLETETNALLYLSVDKIFLLGDNDILESSKSQETQTDYSLLWNYCKYLGLDVADDWQEDDGKLFSEKAQMTIYYIQSETGFLLYIAYNY